MRLGYVLSFAVALFMGAGAVHAQVVTGPNSPVATNLNVVTISTGNVLSVTPAVSGDRRYVGMAIDTQFSSLNGIDTFVLNNPLGLGGGAVGGGPAMAIGGVGVTPVTMGRVPFRPAVVGRVTIVDHDKPLLATQVAALDWKAVSLKDGTRRLADASKLNLVLGIQGFQKAGIDVNSPRDLSLPAGTMKSALLTMLQAAAPETDVVITAEDKVIQVSTQAQADLRLISKTYYLQDLLANMGRYVPGGTDLRTIGNQARPAESHPHSPSWEQIGDMSHSVDPARAPDPYHPVASSGSAIHDRPPVPAKKPVPARASTNILEVITSTVRPEIWKNHGGKSDIYQIGDKVTVTAPASVHAILEGPSTYNPDQNPAYIMYQR